MPIDNRDYTQREDTKRYREWEAEKGVPEETVKEEWTRGRGYLPEMPERKILISNTTDTTNEKSEQSLRIPKLLWVMLAIAIVFFIIAWLL